MSTIKKRITVTLVNSLKPGETAWDLSPAGFGVRCQRSAKAYFLKYRFRGRQRWLTIGRHGSPWTPDTARKEAGRLLGMVAAGVDPAVTRDVEKQAPTMNEAFARFLTEHVARKRKQRTAKEYVRLSEKIILPTLGRYKVKDITTADVERLHTSMGATPYQANRVIALLSKFFHWAEQKAMRPQFTNPCRYIEKYKEERRERMLSPEELGRLGDALSSANTSPFVIAAIKLLIFTGARLNEILTLQWSWINFERGEARLPDSKTGAKTLHFPPPAVTVLAELPREEGNPFVICGQKSGSHLVNLEKPWRAIRQKAELDNVRLHDLRHAFASVAASSGMGLPIIGKMLGHSQPATTARYAHLASDPVKAAAEATANSILSALERNRAETLELATTENGRGHAAGRSNDGG